jgi:hypothetical protein
MDMVESIDVVFQNLYNNIVNSKGNTELIKKYLQDTQHTVLCYTLTVNNNDLEKLRPYNLSKECTVI